LNRAAEALSTDSADKDAKTAVARMVSGWSACVPISLEDEDLTQFGYNIAKGAAALQAARFEAAAAAFEAAMLHDADAPLPRSGLALARRGQAAAPAGKAALKIILKVKDEPELIVKWIEHHAAIVGYDHLIIVDCGSTSQAYWDRLLAYRGRLMILNYDQYYDDIHWPHANRDFYEMLARACQYITVLDADEFLFGYADHTISGGNVLKILRREAEKIYAGTWFSNCAPPPMAAHGIDWTRPLKFSIGTDRLKQGTFSGKSLMLSAVAVQANYIGHNLHVKDVVAHLTPGSFGKIGILHLSDLGPEIDRLRAMKHLYAKSVIPPDLPAEQVDALLATILNEKSAPDMALHYIRKIIGKARSYPDPKDFFETSILCDDRTETHPALNEALDRFDFNALLNAARK
jgi:hypothetical protein